MFDSLLTNSALVIIALILAVSLLFKFRAKIFIWALLSALPLGILYLIQFFDREFLGITPEAIAPLLTTIGLILAFHTVIILLKQLFIELIEGYEIKLPPLILDILNGLLTGLIALAVIRNVLDAELTGLLVTSTVISAIIGLSLQTLLGNVFAGIALQIDAPFAVGDWVLIDGEEPARVINQNWRALVVLTHKNETIFITNSRVAQNKIINYSRPSTRQAQDVFLDIAAHHPPYQVKEILLNAIVSIDQVLNHPPPTVHLTACNTSTVNYKIRYWINDYAIRDDIRDAVLTYLWSTLRRNEMANSPPPANSEQDREIQARQKEQALAVMRSVPILANLTDKELQKLAQVAKTFTYAPGEHIIYQGQKGQALYFIKAGAVGVYTVNELGLKTERIEFESNDFFGEMSLLNDRAFSASVIAKTEAEIIAIDKESFVEILTNDFNLLELMLTTIHERRDKVVSLGYYPSNK